MRKLLAITALLASGLASKITSPETFDDKQSLPVSAELQQQCKTSQPSPFTTLLPLEIKERIFQLIPQPKSLSLVCCEWAEMTRKRRVSKLKQLFKDSYFQRHFETEEKLDQILCTIIAADYKEIVENAEIAAKQDKGTDLLDSFIKKHIERKLSESEWIKRLLMVPSPNSKERLEKLIMGVGSFSGLSLKFRQVLLNVLWPFSGFGLKFGSSLASFLSSFYDRFEKVEMVVVGVDPRNVAKICFDIILGINSSNLTKDKQKQLLDSIQSLFPGVWHIDATCSLYESLSSESSLSEIVEMVNLKDRRALESGVKSKHHESLATIILDKFPLCSEYVLADRCLKFLGKSNIYQHHTHFNDLLLFSAKFQEKHIPKDKRQVVLESCEAKSLLKGLLDSDLTALDIQALLQWINGKVDSNTLSPGEAVMLYSLDKDPNALDKYFGLSKRFLSLSLFLQIALRSKCAKYLDFEKQVKVLIHFGRKDLADLVAAFDCNRRGLVLAVVSLVGFRESLIAKALLKSDLEMWVEACFDFPEVYRMFWSSIRQGYLIARILVKHIGDDLERAKRLQNLPEGYHVMVYLLTPHEVVANFLGERFRKSLVAIRPHFIEDIDVQSQEEISTAHCRFYEREQSRIACRKGHLINK